MSTKSNLGKRNDFKHSQPLGVELIDYSFAVTNFRKETDGDVPEMNFEDKAVETLHTASLRHTMNPNSIPPGTVNDHSESINKMKKKPRRSMLGQRTRLYNIDSAVSISKTLNYGETETDQTNKTVIGTPNENRLKPLHFSSPNTQLLQRYQPQRSTEKSPTPPNPFGYEESASNFFESEINEMGAWSVFKTKQNGIKSPSACSTRTKSHNEPTKPVAQVPPTKTPVRKHFKTKLFDRDEDSVVSDKRNDERRQKNLNGNSTLDINAKKGKSWPYTSRNTQKSNSKFPKSDVVDDKILLDLDSDAPTSDIENIDLNNKYDEKVENNFTCSEETNDNENSPNSDDSFIMAESTIIDSALLTATKQQRSASKAPKLSIICEEDVKNNEKCSKFPTLADSIDESSAESLDQDVNESFKQDLKQLNQHCNNLQMHSEAIDKILEDLLNKKKIYNNYFKQFQEKVNEFNTKYFENNHEKIAQTFMNTKCIRNEQRKKKRVISSKVKHNSPALMLTPENAFASPFTSKCSKSKQSEISKSYTELRKAFSYLKTPEPNKVKKKSCRSSICYTPKSLSVCLNKQLQSLDS